MSIRLVQPGMQCSLQDMGRAGHQFEGIPVSGVMDTFSYRLANILVGNPTNAIVIEFSGFGATLIPDTDTILSLCGGGSKLLVNQIEVPSYRPVYVKAFSVIQLQPAQSGFRSYLAIRGGFTGQYDFGSVSTYPTAELGGMNGKYLKAGNLSVAHVQDKMNERIFKTSDNNNFKLTGWGIAERFYQTIFSNEIRIIKGPEWDTFDDKTTRLLFSNPFTLSEQSNRMGYRLNGPVIFSKNKIELISSAVTTGIIQCTPDGELLLLMADAQTTGGYPRIAKVADVDIARCAQLKPGDKIHFQLISMEEAEELYLDREKQLGVLKIIIRMSYG